MGGGGGDDDDNDGNASDSADDGDDSGRIWTCDRGDARACRPRGMVLRRIRALRA